MKWISDLPKYIPSTQRLQQAKKYTIGCHFVVMIFIYHLAQIVLRTLISLLSWVWIFPTFSFSFERIFTKIDNFLSYLIIEMIVWWCQAIMQLQVIFYGEDLNHLAYRSYGSRLFLSNHISYSDWFSMFFIAHHFGKQASGLLRWILGEGALKIPVFGWAMKLRGYIGLKRNNTKADLDSLRQGIIHHTKSKLPFWLTLYPEGTFVDGNQHQIETVRKSEEFCSSLGKTPFEYLLAPRSRGFTCIMRILQAYVTVEQIAIPNGIHNFTSHVAAANSLVDVTLAFSGRGYDSAQSLRINKTVDDQSTRKLPNPLDLLSGQGPLKIHIHVKSHQISKLPNNEEDLKTWLNDTWSNKDKLLEYMAIRGKFPDPVPLKTPTSFEWRGILFFAYSFLCWYCIYQGLNAFKNMIF